MERQKPQLPVRQSAEFENRYYSYFSKQVEIYIKRKFTFSLPFEGKLLELVL